MALGAEARAVLGEVIGRGMRPVAAGLALGLAAAFALGRTMGAMLYEVKPGDPFTYAAAGTVLLLAGVLGCLAPARRAARVDPAGVLRE
jgi:ABC-type antimicrobial peptide transport system permease subunit